jgi:hypothetical protein
MFQCGLEDPYSAIDRGADYLFLNSSGLRTKTIAVYQTLGIIRVPVTGRCHMLNRIHAFYGFVEGSLL